MAGILLFLYVDGNLILSKSKLHQLLNVITLRAKLRGAVYCYRSRLWQAGGRAACFFVGLLPRKLEIA